MAPKYRTPSPTRETNLNIGSQQPGEQKQLVPIQPVISNTNILESPETPKSNRALPDWYGLPSPVTPGFKNEINQSESSSAHDYQNNSVFAENLGHDRALLGLGAEKEFPTNNVDTTQLTENSQSGVQTEGSCPMSLVRSLDTFGSIEDESSPFSSSETTVDGSSPLNSPNQSQDVQQLPIPTEELPLIIATKSNDQATESDQTQQVTEQDAELARALSAAADLAPLRRSSRIIKNIKNRDAPQPVPIATKIVTTKALSTMQPSPQSHNSMIAIKTDPIHFSGLPELHSVDWQIQYPAGGSTHPSYPYPNLDPRLIFHEGFVPLSNGLPDLSKVPKLFLPMGWTHVTWSGLIPIAFDPYRQAFKLTPVGPLPLTGEELQQNGLYKYVPGGERHPETPHLPKMMEFSDGSDETVYNWEGVDWTLPWTEMNQSLDLFNTTSRDAAVHRAETTVSGHDQLSTINMTPAHYFEPWDCPNGIVDLADAWRWLREKELKPTPIFMPTIGKTWKGTGIHRASRKMKQPIPGLMALTIANATENPEMYLGNQDTRDFCPFRSVATPAHVNVTLLEDVEITLQELLCYFPQHLYWRRAADRLCYAGLSGGDIANMINMTRHLSDDAARRGGTVGHQLRYETCEDGSRVKIERSGDDDVGYTAQGWTYDAWELTDYPLLALTHGLLSLPEGEDAGPLTKLIVWCRNQGRYEVLLSHVPALVSEAGIDKKIERVTGECLDKRMLVRHSEALREDRKRVLEGEKRKKRMLETKEEGRGKKKKTE